jgi:hypothetical protein
LKEEGKEQRGGGGGSKKEKENKMVGFFMANEKVSIAIVTW